MATASDIHWEDYEELVKDIFLALGRASGVAIECWGRSCKVEGPAGVFSQVDVLANHSDGLLLYRTAISCKYWADRVGVKEVRDFAQVVQDARLNKGVMVSKMGFTKGIIAQISHEAAKRGRRLRYSDLIGQPDPAETQLEMRL